VPNSVTIDASSLAGGIQVNANGHSRLFNVYPGTTVTLDNLTLVNGNDNGSGGGAILNQGTLTLNRVTLSSNLANGHGGAIYNAGTLTLNQATVSHNSASQAGAIENYGPLALNCSTLAYNSASGGAGAIDNNNSLTASQCTFFGNASSTGSAIWAGGNNSLVNCTVVGNNNDAAIRQYYSAPIQLVNTIVALNPAGNISGSYSGFNNIVSGDPLLAPLGDYGGPTLTMPPLFGSPALDAGADTVTNSFLTDQRGYPRVSGAHVDIGAVEAQVCLGNPPELTGPAMTGSGPFQFAFANNTPGVTFTVFTTTNLALPFSNWTEQGVPIEIAPGQFQFTDAQATNSPQRFYRVTSP